MVVVPQPRGEFWPPKKGGSTEVTTNYSVSSKKKRQPQITVFRGRIRGTKNKHHKEVLTYEK
jgi:hypothetical protein